MKRNLKENYFFRTIIFMALLFLIIFMITGIACKMYSQCYDDINQYRPFMKSFITSLHSDSFHFYNINDLYGQDFFAMTYYIPLDIFTWLLYGLTYFLDFNLAFGFVQLLEIFLGGIVTYKMLESFNISPKSSHIASIIYITSSSVLCFTIYSNYNGMVIYLPLFILLYKKFFKNHSYLLALYSAYLCFYNIYLAYTLFIGMMLFKISSDFINKENKGFKPFLKEVLSIFKLGILIVLGVGASMCILYPTLMNIFRNGGSTRSYTFNHYYLYYTLNHYIALLLNSVTGIFPPYLVSRNDFYSSVQTALFTSVIGSFTLFEAFFHFKDKSYRRIRIIYYFEILLVVVPIFSAIFSASNTPYSRWFIALDMINIYIIAYILDKEKYSLYMMRKWYLWLTYFVIILIGFGAMIYCYMFNLLDNADCKIASFAISLGVCLFMIFSFKKSTRNFNYLFYLETIALSAAFVFSPLCFTGYMKNLLHNENKFDEVLDNINLKNYERIYVENDFNIYNLSFGYKKATNNPLYFKSFYSKSLNSYINNILGGGTPNGNVDWVKMVEDGGVQNAFILNYKYLVLDKNYNYQIDLNYYELDEAIGTTNYNVYKLKDSQDFMIYDTMSEIVNGNEAINLKKSFDILNYVDISDSTYSLKSEKLTYLGNFTRYYYKRYGTPPSNFNESYKDHDDDGYYIAVKIDELSTGFYYQYYNDFITVSKAKVLFEDDSVINLVSNGFILNKKAKLLKLYYQDQILSDNYGGSLSTKIDWVTLDKYNDSINKMVQKQKEYSKEFNVINNTIELSYKQNDNLPKVLMIPVQYSTNWKAEGYETLSVNGGFLGIYVDSKDENIQIKLKYQNEDLNKSVPVSILFVSSIGVLFIYVELRNLVRYKRSI